MLLAEGFEKAFVGVGGRAGQPDIVVYDFEKCVAILCERDGMDYDDAVEFMHYNVVGSWVGEQTPLFIRIMNNIEELYHDD